MSTEEIWTAIEDLPKQGDFIIITKHSDGQKDVCRVINGQMYIHDPKTEAPATHFKIEFETKSLES